MSRLVRAVKTFLPRGRRLRPVRSGLFRGIRLHLDLESEALIWLGIYERETYAHVARLAADSAACLDIGAGKGELVCYWLRRFPGRPVVAVEPNPAEVELLRRNVAANVSPPAALEIFAGFAGSGPSPARSLSDLCRRLPEPIFVKIDIEGAELHLLTHSLQLLRQRNLRLLVETHGAAVEQGCASTLAECGYRVTTIDRSPWRKWVPEYRPLAHNRWLVAERIGCSA